MVGKNNDFLKNSRNGQKYQRYSLRKLSIGVVSVAIAAGFYFENLTNVQADVVTPGAKQEIVTNKDGLVDKNSQSVVLSSAEQTAKPGLEESNAATSASSQDSTATLVLSEQPGSSSTAASTPSKESTVVKVSSSTVTSASSQESASMKVMTTVPEQSATSSSANFNTSLQESKAAETATPVSSQAVSSSTAASVPTPVSTAVKTSVVPQQSAVSSTVAGTAAQGSAVDKTKDTNADSSSAGQETDAKNVTLDMYVQDKTGTSRQTTISADSNQIVSLSGSFEVTEHQLATADSIMIGTITQKRSDPHSHQNIPVLVRTSQHVITISQGKVQSVELGELHLDKDAAGNIVVTLQKLNHNIKLSGDRKISFSINVAFDLNHASDASAYAGTSYPQTVTFNFNGEELYRVNVTKPQFDQESVPADFSIVKLPSGEEGAFAVHGEYISSKDFNNFINHPRTTNPANLPDDYQWGVNLKGTQGITNIKVSGGARLDVLFDLRNPEQAIHNKGAIPLWEQITSTHTVDNLSLSGLKAQQQKLQYEGLLWSRQSDGSINLWFSWSKTRLHDDWVEAIRQKYGSLENYFKKSLYTTLPDVNSDQFAKDNVEAYQKFVGDNPLVWYQEVHVVSYDPTAGNTITVKANNNGKPVPAKTINTNPGKHYIQGHSFVKIHFLNANSNAKKWQDAEILLPQGPVVNDGTTKTAWQGETSLINFSTLSGYQIVDNDQLAQKWGISQRVLKTNSATVTFPADEGKVADYYVLVKPTVKSIDLHLAYVDDDDNEKPITDPAVDEKISGTVGSTVAVTLPKALENMGYLLNQAAITIAYNGDGTPTFKTDTKGNALVHVRHKITSVSHNNPKQKGDKTLSGKVIVGVQDGDLNRTITRTINVKNLDGTTSTTVQTAALYRDASYDEVTGKVTYGNWSIDSTSWSAVNVPTKTGYNTVINLEGRDTPLTVIAGQSVYENTQPVVINVHYTATATAKLTGSGSTNYTGQPITLDDLNNSTTGLQTLITGPTATANQFSLNTGDVEFSTDGILWSTTLPTDAGTYQVRLTDQGKQAIKDQYGNNNIVWTAKGGNSTITSDATFTINPVKENAVLSNLSEGNYTKVYNGSATTSVDPAKLGATIQFNGQSVSLDMTGLTGADFQWVDANGNVIANPQNVGTYYIKLTDTGLNVLQSHNKNFTLTNSGLGTYTITQAQASATLSGSGTRTYNGSGVTLKDLNHQDADNNITLTLHYPKDGNADYQETIQLTADDFVWNTPHGEVPVDANSQAYTLELKSSVIKQLLEKATGNGQNNEANVMVAEDAITGIASYTITPLESVVTLSGDYGKIYDGTTTTQIDPAQLHLTVNGKKLNDGLTGSDFTWVGLPANTSPMNVGTYSIELTDSGLAKLQDDNPNYALTKAGQAIYTIRQAQGSAVLSGLNSKNYNGTAISTTEINRNGQISVQLTFPGSTASVSYALQDGDYTIAPSDPANANLTNVGTYRIALTDTGKDHIRAKLEELSGMGQAGQANVTITDGAITGDATFTINASRNTVNVSGIQKETYTGQPVNVVYDAAGTNSVKVSFTNATGVTADINGVQLTAGDFQIVDVSGNPITAINANGEYHIILTDAGVAKIQKVVGDNYQVTSGTSYGTLVINKAEGTVKLAGHPEVTYTGSVNPDYLAGFMVTLNGPENPSYKLVDGDLEFNVNGKWTKDIPIDEGTYDVRLSADGWDHIKTINGDNVTWTEDATAMGKYTINAATATAELSGSNTMAFYNHPITTADLYSDGSTIKVAISGTDITGLPTTFKLADGDYTWDTADHTAPKDKGNYIITLTEAGLNKIQKAIDQAVGVGNVVLAKDNTGRANFTITLATAKQVQLYGSEQSTYNGQKVKFDPTIPEVRKNFGFNNIDGLTIPNLTTTDFKWVDEAGNPINAPKDVGTYYLRLNQVGRDVIANANPNYSFTDVKNNSLITGQITYTINPANLVIGVSGTASKVYDGQSAVITQAQLNHGDIKLIWGEGKMAMPGELGKFTLTPDDLVVVDSQGHAAVHANVHADRTISPVYYVRLRDSVLDRIKALSGAQNYNISLATSTGNFLIYSYKAQVTLSGNQTTTYGTDLSLDPTKYVVSPTNWQVSNGVKPDSATILNEIGGMQNGDVYIDGYENGLPTNVGTYHVRISRQLLSRLRDKFPDYDWGYGDDSSILAEHDPATYVIKKAVATVTISGAQHIRYGEPTTIQYGGSNGYTITITDLANGKANNIYSDAKFDAGDLQFKTTPERVGTYTVELSQKGLNKLKNLPDSANYDWKQVLDLTTTPTASFYVNQMPVKITVSGSQTVTYGSSQWLDAIKHDPQNYSLTVETDGGATLDYKAKAGDLTSTRTPGSVGSYDVFLSAQGLANIKAALGPNYTYPQTADMAMSHGTFKVIQGDVTVTLNGSDGKIYDGRATTPADLKPDNYNYTATVYAPDGTAQTIHLTNDDLQLVDAHGNAITPTSAGTYTVELSPSAETRLKNLTGNNGDNYKWTFDTSATYKITVSAEASASLSGSNQKVFDGAGVTTAQINNGGDIEVKFTYPGSTDSSTYQLQDGDYDWYSADGGTELTSAPSQKGTYTIKLTSNGLAHLQKAINDVIGSGNVTLSADQLSGSAQFEIVAKPISNVTISGSNQSKTYDGKTAGLDLGGLSISGTDTVIGNPLSKSGITADNFDWYDESGNKLTSAPTKVGTYKVRLTDSALVALQIANPNYSFDTVNGTITYTINPKAATGTLGGSGNKTYNGRGTAASDIYDAVTWMPSGLIDGEQLDLSGLTYLDYYWATKNSDGTYTVMTGLPTNVGTYYLKLKDESVQKIKDTNPNYSFANGAISGMYTYTINAAHGSAKLTGSANKTYDGHSVTTAEVNSTNGSIEVTLKFPGQSAGITYQLQDGDYDWYDATGKKLDAAPTQVGTYTLRIKPANLQRIIDQVAGEGNVTIDDSNITGSATFTIKPKDLLITLGDKTNAAVGKTYDGQAAMVSPNDGRFTIDGLVSGEHLNTTNIYVDDYSWQDEAGNNLKTAPTNVGTYYVVLNAAGLRQLQADNPNYNVTESGQFKYVISPAEAAVTIGGHQESTTAGITNSNFKVSGDTGIAIPTGLTYQIIGNPTESGVYEVNLTPESLQSLKDANKNYNLNITSTAKFTLKAILTIIFEDTVNGNQQVGSAITKSGISEDTIDLGLSLPTNYELAIDQTLPKTYTFGKQLDQSLIIKLIHKTSTIDPTKPDTNPEPTNADWFRQHGLTKDVTRTITIHDPHTGDQVHVETINFNRTVTIDEVSGKMTYSSWTVAPESKQGYFNNFTYPSIAGYTMTATPGEHGTQILAQEQISNWVDPKIEVSYVAVDQTGKISYVGPDGQEVAHTDLNGKTDQKVAIKIDVPTNWKLVPGQMIPSIVMVTTNGIPTVKVNVEHDTITVTPNEPKTPSDKLPDGTNYPSGVDKDELNKVVTRTITINKPGKKAQAITQQTKFTRSAIVDLVDHSIVYGNWVQDGDNGWAAVAIPEINGYTPTIDSIESENVTGNTKDSNIIVNYTADDQVQVIKYVDAQNNLITEDAVKGKTGQTVNIDLVAPKHYTIVPDQSIPTTVTLSYDNKPIVVVVTPKIDKIADPAQLNKTINRKITVNIPGQEPQVFNQSATFTRTGQYNEVTKQTTYSDWKLSENHLAAYDAPVIPGYKANIEHIDGITEPNVDTKLADVTIDYEAIEQTGKVSYQDEAGNEVSSTSISGKTGSTVKIAPIAPAGWKIVSGQVIPEIVVATAEGIPTVVVKIEHDTITVKPGETAPSGPVPGDSSKNYEEIASLISQPTRIIIVTKPDGSQQIITQTVEFTRTATFDEVTGKVTYSNWTASTG